MILQVGRELANLRAESYTFDIPLDYVDLEPLVRRVLCGGSEDTVEISLLNVVRIHKHELTYAKAHELLDDGAPGS